MEFLTSPALQSLGFSPTRVKRPLARDFPPIPSSTTKPVKLIPVSKKTPCGLPNQGATCYFNAAIQSLLHCPPLTVVAQTMDELPDATHVEEDCIHLWNLFTRAYETKDRETIVALLPKLRLSVGIDRFRGGSQQDSHGFIMAFLDSWATCSERSKFTVHNLFGIEMNISNTCLQCGTVRTQRTLETSLCLPILNPPASLMDSIRLFCTPTETGPENAVDCTTCQSRTERKHQIDIKNWPLWCLIVQWKRDPRIVLTQKAVFPVEHVIHVNKVPMKLQSIVFGGGLQGGHYVAAVRHNDTWWLANDNTVTPMNAPEIHNAQIDTTLFYSIDRDAIKM